MTEQPETPEAANETPAGQEPVGQPRMPEPESEPATAVTPPEPEPEPESEPTTAPVTAVTPPEPATVAADTDATTVTEPATAASEPTAAASEPTPATPAPPAAASFPPAAAPPPPPGPASTQSAGFDSLTGGQEEGLLVQRPEIAVGAAFAGGLVLALLLKRLAR